MVDFVTFGDGNYFKTIHCSIVQAKKFYDGAEFYVYDWGLTPEQREKLSQYEKVHVINWAEKIDPPSLSEKLSVRFYHGLKKYDVIEHWNTIKNRSPIVDMREPGTNSENPDPPSTHRFLQPFRNRQEYLMLQKPDVLLDCATRSNGPLVHLDGDAFIVNNVDEIFDHDFDIAVTLRPPNERNDDSETGPLNAGFIVFNTENTDKIESFITAWKDEIKSNNRKFVEQAALSRVIAKSSDSIFDEYYNEGTIQLDGFSIDILMLPSERYNYYELNKGYNEEINRVLHMKGGQHKRKEHQDLMDNLIQQSGGKHRVASNK